MPKTGKITPQQIQKAKKIIALLPKKYNGITREEAGELLVKDFRLAFKKGYTPQEICFIFREFGITIPVKIVSKYQMADDAADIDGNRLEEICGKLVMKNRVVSNEDGNVSGENELRDRGEMADASGNDETSELEKTGQQTEKYGSASGQTATEQLENGEPVSENYVAGGRANSGAVKQKHWDDNLDMSMEDWYRPAKLSNMMPRKQMNE